MKMWEILKKCGGNELAEYQAQSRTAYEHSNKCCSIGGGGRNSRTAG